MSEQLVLVCSITYKNDEVTQDDRDFTVVDKDVYSSRHVSNACGFVLICSSVFCVKTQQLKLLIDFPTLNKLN